jgi:hypothetical protein
MAAQRPPAAQGDLLAWSPPAPVQQYEAHRVRAATLAGRIKRAIAETLRDQAGAGADRDQIAAAMGEYLGDEVGKISLDAWSSEAREDRMPSLLRFAALLVATADPRLLQVLATECGWVVLDRKWLDTIELASLLRHEKAIARQRRAVEQRCLRNGVLT